MIRSIQNRISLLIAMIGVCMVAGIFITRVLDHQRIDSLLERKKTEGSKFLTHVVDFKSKSLSGFTYDYTFWDEMVNFVTTHDSVWAQVNIESSIPTFQANYAWVFNIDLELVYSIQSEEIDMLLKFPLSKSELENLVVKGPFFDFYKSTPAGLIQFSGGSIHPSTDLERRTPAQGYFFVARIWDPNYIIEIQEFTGTKVSILAPDDNTEPVDVINPEEYSYVNFMPLTSWNNSHEGYIRSVGIVDIARDFEKRSQSILILLVVSLLVALVFVSFILIRLINRPLRNLISSLTTEDSGPIRSLARETSEFGHIARLMSDFFVQKKKLVEEIDERIKIEAELIKALDRAEESDRLKTAFLNNLSHEIRTPMNAIVGFSELITDPRITDRERIEFTGIISDSSYRLLGIINDLISISSLDSGQVEVWHEKINLNSMLQGLFSQIEKEIDHDQIQLSMDVALRDEHSQILTDQAKVSQVILNLLKNSVKFTKSGRIDFGYVMRNSEIEFFVKDTGIGIPEDQFENIFARFHQADSSLSRKFGGTGLGLPISKAYIELMGGRIWLKSAVGQGSEFYFTIPYKAP